MSKATKAIKFKNFTMTDFTWSYDSIPYTFGAGQETYLEDFKAKHFARHLVDRELTLKNIPIDNISERRKLEVLCYPIDEVTIPTKALDIEETKKEKKPKKAEVEFEDLQKSQRKNNE